MGSNLSTIKKINMEDEVSSISRLLGSAEWSGRVSGLKELGRLATSLAGSTENARWLANALPRSLDSSGRSIVDGVQLAMKDLRSLVAAEACRCARQCAESLGSDFCCESWLEQLVVGLQSGSQPKVVAKAADEASRAVVKHVVEKQAWVTAKLCECAKRGRAPTTRTACLEYLAEACASWPSVDGSALAECVVDRARDPVGPTRAAARQLWHALHNTGMYEREATRARDLVDPGTRKQLDRDATTTLSTKATTRPIPTKQTPSKPPLLASVRKKKKQEEAPTSQKQAATPRSGRKAEETSRATPRSAQEKIPSKKTVDPTPKRVQIVAEKKEDDLWSPPSLINISAQEISSLVKQAQSPHWDLRRDAVEALSGGLHSDVAWRCVAICVGDAHHRVASTAIKVAAQGLSSDLDEATTCALLVNCSKRLAEGRADLKSAASALLDRARMKIDSVRLVASILPRLADLSPLKARAALTEFATAVVETDSTVATKLQGDMIFKLAVSLTATISDATRPSAPDSAASAFAASARCAHALRRADRAAFADKVATLAPEMRRAMSDAVDDSSFEDELRDARTRLLANRVGPDEDDEYPGGGGGYSDDEDLLPKFTAMKQKLASRATSPPAGKEDATLAECVDSLSREAGEYGAEAASEARQHICDKARTESSHLRRYFDRIVALLVETGCSGDDPEEDVMLADLAARIESLAALRVLAKWQPELFAGMAQTVVPKLYGVFSQQNIPYELSLAAERALDAVVASRPVAVFDVGVRHAKQSKVAAPVLRVLAHCVPEISRAKLNADMQAILPNLARSVSAPHDPTLRKATLDLLVALYKVLGDTVIPHFKSSLPEHKLKLIATYMHQKSRPLSLKNGDRRRNEKKNALLSATKASTTTNKIDSDDKFAFLSSSAATGAPLDIDDDDDQEYEDGRPEDDDRLNYHTVHHQQQGGGLSWPPAIL